MNMHNETMVAVPTTAFETTLATLRTQRNALEATIKAEAAEVSPDHHGIACRQDAIADIDRVLDVLCGEADWQAA